MTKIKKIIVATAVYLVGLYLIGALGSLIAGAAMITVSIGAGLAWFVGVPIVSAMWISGELD